MNKTYRLVWSMARQAYVVADEKARARGKSSTLRTAVAAAATALLIPTASVSAASLCGDSTNVITDAEMSSCQLGPNSSVEITSTGSINMGIAVPAILAEVDVGYITNAGELSSTGRAIALDAVTVSGKVWNKTSGIITGSTGINVKGSTVQGGIVNDGMLNTVNGIGIDVSGDDDPSQVYNGIVNTGTINADWGINAKNATVNGGINNTGTITTGTYGIHVENATINGGIDNTGTIANGGYGINLQNTTIDGSITNSGSLAGVYSGLYIDDNSVISRIKNNGSIIGHYEDTSSYSVALYIGYGSEVLSIENNGTISGDRAAIISDGTLGNIVIGNNAKFIGDVRATGTDVVLKSDAAFKNINAFDVKSITVEQGATFNITEGLHTFQQFTFMPINFNDGIKVSNGFLNNGTAAVAPGVVGTIHGDYTQSATGRLSFGVAGDDAYGKLVVDGTASLPSNANIFVDVKTPAGYSFSVDRLQGVLTADTLNSDGTFKVEDNSLLFAFEAVKNDNSIDLSVKKTAALRQIADVTGNNPAFGAADALDRIMDSNSGSALSNYFMGLTSNEEITNALSQVLPLLTGASTTAASSALSSINRVIQARMDSNAGLSSGEGFLTDKHLWLKPFGSWADQDNRSGVAGYNADTMGFAIGSDAALNDKVRVGVAFAYAKADVDGASRIAPQSMDVDVYQLIGYGSYSLGSNTELNFQVDVGQNDNSGKRGIGFANLTAKSDYNSLSTHLGAGIGHTLNINDGITFTPSARLDYTAIRDEGYSEKGADDLNLKISSNRTEELIASVDGKFNLKVTDNTAVALNLGAGYDVTDNRASITAAFAGEPGFGFTTYGINQNRWLLRSGIGLTHTADNGTEVSARYDNESRSGFSNQTASLKVRWAF